jgi:hypothetical protein
MFQCVFNEFERRGDVENAFERRGDVEEEVSLMRFL